MNPSDPNEFNSKLAKLLQGLKKEGLALKVRQGYKGTGSKAHKRQIWIDFNANVIKPLPGQDFKNYASCTDIWLETHNARIGGVVNFTAITPDGFLPTMKNPSIKYADQTPEAVYARIVELLKSRA